MAITSPEKYWWKPADKEEKLWITIALLWCLVLTIMMPLMHFIGTQNPSVSPMRIKIEDYRKMSDAFIE